VTELVIKVGLSYLLGSIIGSLVIGRLRGGVDIRRLGSGNAGSTNALRTQGKRFAFWVFLIDIGKGWVATGLIAPLLLPGILHGAGPAPSQIRDWLPAACGIAVILGHVYPVWYGFRGGKGVATVVGAVLGLSPSLLVPMLATWLVAVILVGFVGLASILGAVALAVTIAVSGRDPRVPLLTFGALTAANAPSFKAGGLEPRMSG